MLPCFRCFNKIHFHIKKGAYASLLCLSVSTQHGMWFMQEREKKARKKERKKTGVVEVTDVDEGEIAPSLETATETPSESETREKPMTVTKRSQKPSQFTKQTKAKSIPPPLRNRGKRRMQTWMWVLLAAVVVFALFLVGNSSFSFNFGLQRFGF